MEEIKLTEYAEGKYQLKIPSFGGYLDISFSELVELEKLINEVLYYSKDIKGYCKEEDIDLSEEAFQEVLDEYARLRIDNDGDDCGMVWTDCLEAAFENTSYKYGDSLTDNIWELLKKSFSKDKEDFYALIDELGIEISKNYSSISDDEWKEIKIAISDMDNDELVSLFYDWLE